MIDDIYQLTIIQRLQAQVVENVIHWKVTADADGALLEDALHTYAVSNFAALASSFQSTDLTYQASRAQKIWPLPARVASERPMFTGGSVATQALPAEVAAVITKQSFFAGRAFRGRVYMAGLPAAAVVAATGLFDDATVGNMGALGVSLADTIHVTGGGVMKPVIYHRVTHTTTDVVTCLARNTPRVQRRRQIGRGI